MLIFKTDGTKSISSLNERNLLHALIQSACSFSCCEGGEWGRECVFAARKGGGGVGEILTPKVLEDFVF